MALAPADPAASAVGMALPLLVYLTSSGGKASRFPGPRPLLTVVHPVHHFHLPLLCRVVSVKDCGTLCQCRPKVLHSDRNEGWNEDGRAKQG